MRGHNNASDTVRKGVLEERTRIDKLENENYELKLKIRLLQRKRAEAAVAAQSEPTSSAPASTDPQLVQENSNLKEENKRLQSKLESLPARISAKYQKDVDDYFEQVRTELIAKRRLEKRVAELESSRYFETSPPVISAQPPLSPAVDQLTRDLSQMRAAKIEAESRAAALKDELNESRAAIDQLQTDNTQLSQLAGAVQQQAPLVQDPRQLPEFIELEQENKRLQLTASGLETAIAAAEGQLRDLKKRQYPPEPTVDIAALEQMHQSEIRRLELQLASARQEIETNVSPHELAAAKAELSRVQVEIAELEGENKVLENKLRSAQLHIELADNKYRNLEKRYAQKKDGDMRVLHQKADLERELETTKVMNIELGDEAQALKTSLAREARARQVVEQRNTELQQVLARHKEPSRIVEASMNHRSLEADRFYRKENDTFDARQDMDSLKHRLGIDSTLGGF